MNGTIVELFEFDSYAALFSYNRYYGVIVVEDPQELFQPENEDFVELYPNPQPYDENSDVNYYITAAWNVEENVPENFTVGDTSTVYAVRDGVNESYFNAALKRYTSYCIYAEVQTRTANVSTVLYSWLHVI